MRTFVGARTTSLCRIPCSSLIWPPLSIILTVAHCKVQKERAFQEWLPELLDSGPLRNMPQTSPQKQYSTCLGGPEVYKIYLTLVYFCAKLLKNLETSEGRHCEGPLSDAIRGSSLGVGLKKPGMQDQFRMTSRYDTLGVSSFWRPLVLILSLSTDEHFIA